jgi:pentatricopeptide repeat protein
VWEQLLAPTDARSVRLLMAALGRARRWRDAEHAFHTMRTMRQQLLLDQPAADQPAAGVSVHGDSGATTLTAAATESQYDTLAPHPGFTLSVNPASHAAGRAVTIRTGGLLMSLARWSTTRCWQCTPGVGSCSAG